MASEWNVISTQQSFIDRAIDQWWDYFNACLKAKNQHFEQDRDQDSGHTVSRRDCYETPIPV